MYIYMLIDELFQMANGYGKLDVSTSNIYVI